MTGATNDRGMAIPEILVALLVSMILAGAAVELILAAEQAAAVLPDSVDVQQRLRVATDALVRDIGGAGAGLDGGSARGPLVWSFAAVLPRRLGLQAPDAPTAARSDALTVIAVPSSTPQTSTGSALAPGGALVVSGGPACPSAQALCGLAPGADLLVFDRAGAFDLFTLADTSGGLVAHGAGGRVYDAGSPISEVAETTYYFDAATSQLRQYDGYQTDVPLVDNVVGLRFEYLGSPDPPLRPKPPPGVENCLYDAGGAAKPLPTLTPTDGALALLPLSMLADGPWCGAGATVFDADLLRVRAIRVTLRLQAASASARGEGPDFLRPGFARAAWRMVPDAEVTFVVRPRNLR